MKLGFEAILLFALLLHLRRTLKTFSPDPLIDRWLKNSLIATGVYFIIDGVLRADAWTQWPWHAALIYVIHLGFRDPRFAPSRMTLYAVLPIAVISILTNSLSTLIPAWKITIKEYGDYAEIVAFTWLVALLILSRKQLKALKEEHRKRLEEEEEHQRMMARKAELEALVAERTAELVQQKEELHLALEHLKATQDQLVQREKMASLGELTAGVAHEIQNPLNFVNNFSEISLETAEELQQRLRLLPLTGNDREELDALLSDLVQNQKKIHHHGSRADAIVKSMLMHSQRTTGQRELININALAEEYLRLTYHGIRAKDKTFTAALHMQFDEQAGAVPLVPQDIGRVLINLFNNAFYAVKQKKKALNGSFEPEVTVVTRKAEDAIAIIVKDNGPGIPETALDKIFQPFFTTKPTGEGTGLGLSLSYDIVTKGHGGALKVETKEGEGAVFKIILPTGAKSLNSNIENA
jgi:signal transduction histidine kinase